MKTRFRWDNKKPCKDKSAPSVETASPSSKEIFQTTFIFPLCELKLLRENIKILYLQRLKIKTEIVGFEIGCGLNKWPKFFFSFWMETGRIACFFQPGVYLPLQ